MSATVALAIVLVFLAVFGVIAAAVASRSGDDWFAWGVLGSVLGPIGLILLWCDRRARVSEQHSAGLVSRERPGFEARILEAALEAERETGVREETIAEARSRIAVRLLRMGCGSLILVIGVVLLPLPGPGWLVIAIGLGILARDVAWAERALERVRHRIPTDDDGRMTRASMATMVTVALASLSGSLWWLLR